MSDAVIRYREAFQDTAGTLPGSAIPWLRDARREAMGTFEAIGFPKPREEDWKYTRVAPIEKRDFALTPPDTPTPLDLGALLLPESTGAWQAVFVDGRFRADLSRTVPLPGGVHVADLAGSLERGGDELQRWITGAGHRNGFTALNAAFTGHGLHLQLDDGVTLDVPVHLLFVASGIADTIVHPRVILEIGKGARATVVESYAALGESPYFNNVVTQAALDEGARLDHYKLQREATAAFHVSTFNVHQDAGSRFESHSVSLGAALARHDINVALDAPEASCALNGLYMVRGRQHVDYHTRVDHVKPACTSTEDYRGILAGRARGVFNGRVYVHPQAQKSDATQSNRNLLLSRDAEVDTKPQLEIHADDVKCAHGATVGQLDEGMIFYLRSRGIDESSARGLLTYGFARGLVDRMAVAPLREAVAESLLDRLPNAEELRSMLS